MLLGFVPWSSTLTERDALNASKIEEYEELKRSWMVLPTRANADILAQLRSIAKV